MDNQSVFSLPWGVVVQHVYNLPEVWWLKETFGFQVSSNWKHVARNTSQYQSCWRWYNKYVGCHVPELVPPTQSKDNPQKSVLCARKIRNIKNHVINANNVLIIQVVSSTLFWIVSWTIDDAKTMNCRLPLLQPSL